MQYFFNGKWKTYNNYSQVPVVFTAPVVTPDGPHSLDVAWSAVSDSNNRIKVLLNRIVVVNIIHYRAI